MFSQKQAVRFLLGYPVFFRDKSLLVVMSGFRFSQSDIILFLRFKFQQ